VANELGDLIDVYFQGIWHGMLIQPRLIPLIIGPSGAGKTWLVQSVAAAKEMPLLQLNVANWIPLGANASAGMATLKLIQQSVENHPRGIIHIDELDKFGFHDHWDNIIRQDVFSVLDRRTFNNLPDNRLQQRLEQNWFIIGSGTWQSVWERHTKDASGFNLQKSQMALTEEVRYQIDKQNEIPPELQRRFNSRYLIVDHPNEETLEAIIEQFKPYFEPRFCEEVRQKIPDILKSKKGIRWFEEYLTDFLVKDHRAKPKASNNGSSASI
jgi:hypothetical protein